MKALVFGGTGKIGSAVALDLARFGGAETIGIVGRSQDALQKTRDWIGREKVATHLLDINDARRVRTLMKEYDVGIITLPDRRRGYKTIETAIGSGLSAMARVTGSPAAIAARLLEKGEIRKKGIVAPKEALKDKAYEVLMKELKEREITVVERILPIGS